MKANILQFVLLLGSLFYSFTLTAQTTAPDEDGSPYTTCNPDGANATKTSNDLSPRVNVGAIDDRSCYANYKESSVNGKTWGVYNITHNSNNQDEANTLQPRIERSLSRSQTTGIGSFAKFTGTVRILEVGKTSNTNNDGTYIMQAKGKHTGGGGSADPAICLFLAKPVLDVNDNQISFDIYREQINYRGGEGSVGRTFVFLKNILKNVETAIELEVGFRQDPTSPVKKIHYADAKIGGTDFKWNIPEPEKGTQSGIRYGAYRVKGGRAQIRWANTTYQKVEVAATGATITSNNNGNWNSSSTWSGGVIPTINDNVIINSVVTLARNGVGGLAKSITCNASPAQLIIRENTKLTVTGDINLTRSDNAIVIYGQWAGTKTGTMIFGGTYTVDKKTTVRKRLTENKWHLISNPFLNPKVNHTTANSGTKLKNNGSVLSLASYNDGNASGSKYTYYTNGTILDAVRFGTAQGYAISVASADVKDDYVMQGIQHEGAVSYTLSTGGNGYNLIGNPYISYIHANDEADNTNNILRVNGVLGHDVLAEDTFWLWDADNGVWITKNRGDSNGYRINPLQGFFVKAKTAGNFSFTKNMETHDASNSAADDTFLKTTKNRFTIDLSVESNKLTRNTQIRYITGASTTFDNGYDSSLFEGYSSDLELYTGLVSSGAIKKLAIQSLPNKNFEEIVIPVGITAGANSVVTFKAVVSNMPKAHKLFLEDRLLGTFTRINETNGGYTVTLKNATSDGRFFIHTKTAAVLHLDAEFLNSVNIYKTNNANLRIVGLQKGKVSVALYNLIGKQVMNTAFSASNSVEHIALPSLAKGVYLIQLQTKKGKLNKRIMIK